MFDFEFTLSFILYQKLLIKNLCLNCRADGGTRRGNMGHLTRIANMVVQNLEKGPVQAQITDLIKGDASVFIAR